MEKNWFAFFKGRHQGPYTIEEIEEKVLRGQFFSDIPLWREGMRGWVPYVTVSRYLLIDEPAEQEIPDIPEHLTFSEIEIPDIPLEALKPKEPIVPETPIIINQDSKDQEADVSSMVESEQASELSDIENADNAELDKVKESSHFIDKRLLAGAFVIAFIVFSALGSHYFIESQKFFLRPRGMSMLKHSELLDLVKKSPVKFYYDFLISRDRKKFWLASNYPYKTKVKITLKSIPGKILAAEEIELEAEALFDQYFSQIEKQRFIKGDRLYSGKYQLVITGIAKPEKRWWHKFYTISTDRFSYSQEILIGFKSDFAFQKALNQKFNNKLEEQINLFRDIEQKYLTLNVLIDQVLGGLHRVAKKYRHRRELRKFEKKYELEIGTFLLTIATIKDQEYTKKYLKYPELLDKLKELTDSSHEVANNSSYLMAKLKKPKTLKRKYRNWYSNKIDELFLPVKKSNTLVIEELAQKITELRSQIIKN